MAQSTMCLHVNMMGWASADSRLDSGLKIRALSLIRPLTRCNLGADKTD